MDKPTCGTCPYWDENPAVSVYWAVCRRNPPTIEGDERRGISLETHRENWCGEHPDFPAWIAEQRKPKTIAQCSTIEEVRDVLCDKRTGLTIHDVEPTKARKLVYRLLGGIGPRSAQSPEWLEELRKKSVGNAMSVQAVGVGTVKSLRAWMQKHGCDLLVLPGERKQDEATRPE